MFKTFIGNFLLIESKLKLNKDKEPIPGLYQCGELIGGAASVGGLANTVCVVCGKIAAQSAIYCMLCVKWNECSEIWTINKRNIIWVGKIVVLRIKFS